MVKKLHKRYPGAELVAEVAAELSVPEVEVTSSYNRLAEAHMQVL